MNKNILMQPREILRSCFDAGVQAVDPEVAVRGWLRAHPLDFNGVGRVFVIGAGKAAAPMAVALEAELGNRIAAGVIVVKHGHALPLTRIAVYEGGHPLPDAAGQAGAQALWDLVQQVRADDLVVACWSGGASALLALPRSGVSLADLQVVSQELLRSGAPITEMNALRKHLSRITGGQLAAALASAAGAPVRVEALVLSDVIGDDLSTIASGPLVGDPSTWAACAAAVECYRLELPAAVRALIAAGLAGVEPETPKPGDSCFSRMAHAVVGSNAVALHAIAARARELDCAVTIIDHPVIGEAGLAAELFCRRLVTQAAGHRGRHLLIAGGEPTVTLTNVTTDQLTGFKGRGGRAQEFAAACVGKLAGHNDVHILAAGTDGSDGPTDAAGAFVDGTTAPRADYANLNFREALTNHDAYPFFQTLKDLFITGPTRTNVMDVFLGLS